jgi:hypothetical protein
MGAKITVVVSGGNVQNCYSTDSTVEIEVIDFDNVAEDGEDAIARAEERLAEIRDSASHIY